MHDAETLTPVSQIERIILLVRGERVILDSDLAILYGVKTKNLVKAVKRNIERFPSDFMFQLTNQEVANLRFQFGTSSSGQDETKWGGRRYPPFVFTEHGVAMLSSILRSKKAVQVNIEIVRTFVRLRRLLSSNVDLARKLTALEKKYDAQFKVVFDAIRELMTPPEPKRRPIGFNVNRDR